LLCLQPLSVDCYPRSVQHLGANSRLRGRVWVHVVGCQQSRVRQRFATVASESRPLPSKVQDPVTLATDELHDLVKDTETAHETA
jgi:hypothetical protein